MFVHSRTFSLQSNDIRKSFRTGRMARHVLRLVQNSLSCQIFICVIILLFIYVVYSSWTVSTFTDNNDKFYRTEILDKKFKQIKQKGKTKVEQPLPLNVANKDEEGDLRPHLYTKDTIEEKVDGINVIVTFTKAQHNYDLQSKFRVTIDSIFRFSSIALSLHIIGDSQSQAIASQIVSEIVKGNKHKCKMVNLDIDTLAKQLHEIVKEMQVHFSYKPGAYYSDSLFFLSIAIHRVMPDTMHKVIMLDADLKFNADISELYKLFKDFSSEHVIGIARENQPVYRHTFHMYRNRNPGTRVGEPPPDGVTGFNSGVLLLDLDRMRKSSLYNHLIDSDSVRNLSQKYMFKGHLGDQDFFTLLSLEHENLFYVLPCTWNRQLCVWWKDKGYEFVFDKYFQCQGHINIYHGNCNTKIPKLEWEDS